MAHEPSTYLSTSLSIPVAYMMLACWCMGGHVPRHGVSQCTQTTVYPKSITNMSCPWLHSIIKVHGSPLTYRVLLRGEHEVKLFVYIFGVYIYLFLQKGFNAPGGILLYDDDISDVVC